MVGIVDAMNHWWSIFYIGIVRHYIAGELISTPRRELAPPIEEDEEQDSESFQGVAPLRQIENNISALLRGDIIVARVGSKFD